MVYVYELSVRCVHVCVHVLVSVRVCVRVCVYCITYVHDRLLVTNLPFLLQFVLVLQIRLDVILYIVKPVISCDVT